MTSVLSAAAPVIGDLSDAVRYVVGLPAVRTFVVMCVDRHLRITGDSRRHCNLLIESEGG
jgi:hypothetical protein